MSGASVAQIAGMDTLSTHYAPLLSSTTPAENTMVSFLTLNLPPASSPSAIPEMDPAGMGSMLALIGGGLGLLELHRKRA